MGGTYRLNMSSWCHICLQPYPSVGQHHHPRNLTWPALRADAELQDFRVVKKGSGLSITPVEPANWNTIVQWLGASD